MNQDFYPTPKALIRKMLNGIDLHEMNNVLEPSAGKGDICDYLSQQDHRRGLKIDAIEIDQDLQHIIKGKDYNLVFDNFLEFDTNEVYDLIIANFPFSDGDAHLQRALYLLKKNGGNLVCLVNAETIRNPFTNLRQAVINELTRLDAKIEYLQQEFVEAERKTDVEVALVRVSAERPEPVSLIIGSLKKSKTIDVPDAIPNELIEQDFFKALVIRFDVECDLGIRLIEEYFILKPRMMDRIKRGQEDYANELIELKVDGAYATKASYINSYLCGVRHKFWELLIDDPRFSGAYTSNILKDLNSKLAALRDCDFNLFNIRELEKEMQSKIVTGIEKSILGLFDEFSRKYAYGDDFSEGNIHYYNGWKSNKAHKINKRIVVPINGFSAYSKDKLDYSIRERLVDMVKVFNYLSDQPEESVAQLVADATRQAEACQDFSAMQLRYFELTFYKKGTCHIKFKDDRLLDKFNIFGSQRKGWLPPSYGRKAYREMNADEKAVVDDFQGEDKYNEILNEKDYYLVSDTKKLLLN